MAGDALSAPLLVAALVLCGAALAKLRSPFAARDALRDAGPVFGARIVGAGMIRSFAAIELGIGAWALLAPSRGAAAAVCALYALFTGLAARLALRGRSCGCFGAADAPASGWQVGLSAAFAGLAGGAAGGPVHGLGWVLGLSGGFAVPTLLGLVGAAYATVLAYTALPAAWRAWGGV